MLGTGTCVFMHLWHVQDGPHVSFLQPHACIWAPASSLGGEGVWPSACIVLTDWNAIMLANFIIHEHAISSCS